MRDYLLVIFGFATFGLGFLVIQLFKWLSQFKLVKKDDSIKKRAYAKRVVEPPETPNCRCAMPEEYEPKKTTNSVLAKLNESQVADIYTSKDIPRVLAEKYGVSRQAIQDIKGGITWRYVTKDLQKPEKKRKNKSVRDGKKLTEKDVLDIYKSRNYTYSDLAKHYKVSISTIQDIKSGSTWHDITSGGKPVVNLATLSIVDKENIVKQVYNDFMFIHTNTPALVKKYNVTWGTVDYLKGYSPCDVLKKYINVFDLPAIREFFDKAVKTSDLEEIKNEILERFTQKKQGDHIRIGVIVSAMYRSTYWRTK